MTTINLLKGLNMASSLRKHLSAPGLINTVNQQFRKISDPRKFARNGAIALKDHLMSGLAVFGLKCQSLLDYDRRRSDNATEQNLRDLYQVDSPPSDTYLRERLDEVNPDNLRPAFKKLFASFQRGKGLEAYEYIEGRVLITIDGTGLFASNNISCPHCCVKQYTNGTKSYYHQMLGAKVMVVTLD